MQSLRKFPRLYSTVDLVDWKNLPDRPRFLQTDTIMGENNIKNNYELLCLHVN